ncbi:MAG: DJ-1/PfpI family protein [Lentisphaeria bacterium]|nr:DJ-1/PfpI family protein [Lentisphaeria bacterium]MBQ7404603.1 DJ-1/PfpI family protein [Lentisphaeria bacterium]
MRNEIAILLADGFEEIEALAPADIFRRLGLKVILAGVTGKTVASSRGIQVNTEVMLEDLDPEKLQLVYLPGGLPGATNLRDNPGVIELIRTVHAAGGFVSAICAAPIVLAKAGLSAGRKVTGYPTTEDGVEGLVYTGELTEDSGDRILTGKGPGAAIPLTFRLAEALGIPGETLNQLKQGMFL